VKRTIKITAVIALVLGVLLYALIPALQHSDANTIKTAKEVDAFIRQYCQTNGKLPIKSVLQSQFPNLKTDAGWFFFTDDKKYLRMQYPMKWQNADAIGERNLSEFTGTVYAYTVDYQCKTGG